MRNPIRDPKENPMRRTTGITTHAGQSRRSRYEESTAEKAKVDATEMSIFPVMSTNMMPTEAMRR
jgi:hypothetical protein